MFNTVDHSPHFDDPLLTPQQKAKYLASLLEGMAHIQILYSIRASQRSYYLTKKADAFFSRDIARIHKSRPEQVETALYQYATGQAKMVKSTYRAKMDEETAEIEKDEEGEVIWEPIRKEVTQLPCNPALVKLLLERKT